MNPAPFSYAVVVGDIPPEGRHFRLEADPEERRQLAEALDIPEVTSLLAELDVRPTRRGAFRVRGRLNATIVQTDVVTLDPLAQEVEEEIDVTLMRADKASAPARAAAEVLVDPEQAEEPEPYHRGRIELGAIVSEHLALGLDPYPRAPGVAFEGHTEDDAPAGAAAFAALARLKGDDA
jgi:uncharacterized protein